MNKYFNQIQVAVSKVSRQHIQIFFLVLSLSLFVLGAGAPDDGGNIGR